MQTETRLCIENLRSGYGPITVLGGVSLTVGAAPMALIGRNGMGKTTLCKAIMGLLPLRLARSCLMGGTDGPCA